MPRYEITSPDGKRFEITAPDNATQEQVLAYAKSQFNTPTDALDNPNMATEGQSFGQNALAGAGKAFTDLGRGLGQFVGAVPQSEIDESAARDKPLMKTGGGVTGNILGNVAAMLPSGLIPGAGTIAGGGAIGGVMGALQPVESKDSRSGNIMAGLLGGAAGSALTKGVSKALSPNTSEQAKLLLREGITPTPGQLMGGRAQVWEDKLTSLPGLGDAIASARGKGLNEFQRAAYARALAPIGEKPSGELGREGVANARNALSDAYERLLPKVTFKADQQVSDDLTRIRGMVANIGEPEAKQFNSILSWMQNKITPSGLMNGESLKEVESELSRLARGYRGDPSFDKRQLGAAIDEVNTAIRQNLARVNPDHADELKAINTGWANYSRLRDAASRQGAVNGEFTPSQLAAAIRSQDKTVGKRAYSEGSALMQDLSDAGKNVLASKYPDSGTTGRALAGMLVNPLMWPKLATGVAGAGVASLPYLPGGRQATAAMMAKRPDIARKMASLLRETSPQIGMAGAAGMIGQE